MTIAEEFATRNFSELRSEMDLKLLLTDISLLQVSTVNGKQRRSYSRLLPLVPWFRDDTKIHVALDLIGLYLDYCSWSRHYECPTQSEIS